MPKADLAGIGIAVTRPAHQAAALCKLIEERGGRPFLFPIIEILDPADISAAARQVDRLSQFDLAIFISPNAVERALPLIRARGGFPAGLRLATVGKGTSRALEQLAGRQPDLQPTEQFDSAGLLQSPELADPSGRRILIFRGEGGRELLASTLQQRGAEVAYAEVYRRGLPPGDASPLLQAFEHGDVSLTMITSGDGLRNLVEMAGEQGRQRLLTMPLVVVSERLAELAQVLGFATTPRVARAATNEALIEAAVRWAAAHVDGEVG